MPKYTQSSELALTAEAAHIQLEHRRQALLRANASRPPDQLGLCLDASSSMSSLVPTVVEAYNQFLTALPETAVTVCMFGTEPHLIHRSVPAANLAPMTPEQYEILGATALLDGLGSTIAEVGAVYDPPPKASKPRVLIALLTDGAENMSRHYNLEDLRHSVAYRRITCSWQFLYLTSAGVEYGLQLGIERSHIAEFSNDPADLAALLERVRTAAGAFYLGDRNFIRFLLKEEN